MDNKELLEILDQRFNKIDEKFDKIDEKFDKIDEKFDKIDERLDKMDERFDKMDERLDKMDKGFKEFNDKMNKGFREINDKVDKGFEDINNRLDVLTNSNLAQILNAQTRNTKEITDKLDRYIVKNERDHKKFDYEIADTKMKLKFAR